MLFSQPISTTFTVSVRTEREGYLFICMNEMLHTLGLISEDEYAVNYAIISDNDIFKLF